MFAGLHDVDWASMRHAYGSAAEVPALIEGLRSADPEVRADALDRFHSSVHHQGDVYACTTASLPFLFELAEDPAGPGRGDVVGLLASIGEDAILTDFDMPERIEAAALMRARAATFLTLAADADPEVRSAAILMLGYVLDDPAPLRELLATARSRPDQLEIVGAVGTLADREPRHFPPMVAWLAALAADPSATPELRLAAIAERACLGDAPVGDEVVPVVLSCLREIAGFPPRRRAETGKQIDSLVGRLHRALGDRGAERIDLLAEQLSSPGARARVAGLREIESLLGRTAEWIRLVELVASQLSVPDHRIVAEAAIVLGRSPRLAGPAREALAACVAAAGAEAWGHEDLRRRRSHQEAVRALARLGDERAVPSLLVALETDVDLSRAMEVVASLPSATDVLVPRLCDYLSGADPTASGTGKVMDALADLGDPAAVPAIVGILRALGPAGPTWPIWSALRALSAFGAASAPALSLIRPLADRGDTRHLAVDVLWTVGRDPGETLPPLLRMLDDDVPSEFRQAADVLAEIGPAAAPALPGLRRRLSDPYHWTKVSAARAVWAIGGETEAPAVIDALVRAAAEEPVTIKHAVECFARMAAVGSPALARLRAELDDPAAGPHDERLHPRAAGGRFADDETLRATAQSVLTQVDDAGSVMP